MSVSMCSCRSVGEGRPWASAVAEEALICQCILGGAHECSGLAAVKHAISAAYWLQAPVAKKQA